MSDSIRHRNTSRLGLRAAISMVITMVGLTLTPLVAFGQPSTESQDREGRALFEAGREAYAAAQYERALEYFQRSYELSGRPELLFNIAQSADRARRDDLALASYERFVELVPDSPWRSQAESRIEFFRSRPEEAQVAQEAPEVDAVPAAESRTVATSEATARSSRLPGWLLVGGGAAIAVTGGALLGMSAAARGNVEDASVGTAWSSVSADYDRAPTLGTAGLVSLGVGVVAAAAGVTLLALTGPDERELDVAVGPTGFYIKGRF